MLFDSFSFLFIFLPAVWFGFQILCWTRCSNWLIMSWLIATSLYFYGSVYGSAIILFLVLAGINFGVGRSLRSAAAEHAPCTGLLWLGVLINAGSLIGLKYLPAATGFRGVLLPVGFSFFIFAQIQYLVDARQGNAPAIPPLRYVLFSIWFPYMLSGPIVKAEEIIGQFQFDRARLNDLTLGVSYIAIGLFKKCCLASAATAVAVPFFMPGSPWLHTPAFPAWTGALAFTLQIYFDFSGYSDMAIGVARLFGIRLPINFSSPLKAVNISEFWSHWHMTLTRFLTSYIYYPLALIVSRARIARTKTRPGEASMSLPNFLETVACPLIVTMLITGAWHGAQWTFVVFGLLHGVYLSAMHGWHLIKARVRVPMLPKPLAQLTARILMLGSLAASMVFFGSPDCSSACSMLASMAGVHGWLTRNAPFPTPLGQSLSTLTVLFLIVFFLPNSQEWLSRDEAPVSPLPRVRLSEPGVLQRWFWQTRPRFALIWGALLPPAIIAILASPGSSGFIYFKF
jgi:alginate O-acetyltransferase complex protein AlgI